MTHLYSVLRDHKGGEFWKWREGRMSEEKLHREGETWDESGDTGREEFDIHIQKLF